MPPLTQAAPDDPPTPPDLRQRGRRRAAVARRRAREFLRERRAVLRQDLAGVPSPAADDARHEPGRH